MFDGISHRYDLLNRLLSAGIDVRWRKKALRMLERHIQPCQILDVATGTADLALTLAERWPSASVMGVDISEGMLAIGRQKIQDAGLAPRLELRTADAENLPFEDGLYDAVTVAFGVRNFENLETGLSELARVLRPGGILLILEFSRPGSWFVRQGMNFYSRTLMPALGGWLSRDRAAYTYLPESVAVFPEGPAFEKYLSKTGLKVIESARLSMGIASIYLARKS
jgi:demethylmenaquinone methyltransferase/2-methoxy-6-polyprenyl-1,4-benzoquinol methylase